jgi:hypothetical protein
MARAGLVPQEASRCVIFRGVVSPNAEFVAGFGGFLTREPAVRTQTIYSLLPTGINPRPTSRWKLPARRPEIFNAMQACTDRTAELCRSLAYGQCLPTDAATAELVTLSENACRDVSIAFAIQLSLIAEARGVDVWELVRLANYHPQGNILIPGPGAGGRRIAVAPWLLTAAAPHPAGLIRQARAVNDGKPDFIVRKVRSVIAGMERS